MVSYPHNPGKYDDICTLARLTAHAKGIVIIVYDGQFGNGVSAQCDTRLLKNLVPLLRQVADDLERKAADHDEPAADN